MEERQEQETQDTRVAVVEAPNGEEHGPASARQRLHALEAVYTDAVARLAALTAAVQEDVPSLAAVQEIAAIEKWLITVGPQLEQRRRAALQAQTQVDLTAAVQHHDSFIEPKKACYVSIALAVEALFGAFAQLKRLDIEQKEPLTHIVKPGGGPPFAQLTADELHVNVVGRMPPGWTDVLLGLSSRPLHAGDIEAMQDVDGGCKPISERAIRRFLES